MQGGAHSEQQQCLSAPSSSSSTPMSQCLSHAWPNLDFCPTMGWPCSWGCCSKLSIGQSSSQQISTSLFAFFLLLLPSSLQRKKYRRRDENPGYRVSKARHQVWITLGLRTKPTLHDCNEPNNHPEVAHGNDFPDPCLSFCSLLHSLTYSSPRTFTAANAWDRKVFLTIRSSGLIGYFWSFLLLQLLSFIVLLVCKKTRCKRSLENQTTDYILWKYTRNNFKLVTLGKALFSWCWRVIDQLFQLPQWMLIWSIVDYPG